MLSLGVEKPAIGTPDAICAECLFQIVRLEEDREAGDSPLTDGR